MKPSLFTDIRTRYNTLSPTQKKIADFVLSNPDKVILFSISDLAQQCNTSETTIMRFLRKLDYDSYQVFRVNIAQEISAESPKSIYEEIKQDDDINQTKEKVIHLTIDSIKDLSRLLDNESLEKVVESIIDAKRIFFFGVGASASIAKDAFHKLLRLGLNVSLFGDPHMMNILSVHTNPEDVIIVFTHSGESREVLDAIELAKENNTKVIAITSYAHSSITKLCDIILLSSTNETAYRSDAMISRIIQLVIIDIIYVGIVLKIGSPAIQNVNKSRLAVAKKKR